MSKYDTDWQALGLPSEPGKTAFDVQIKPTELTPQQLRNKAKWENKKKNRIKSAATRVNRNCIDIGSTFEEQVKTSKLTGKSIPLGRDA